MSTKTKQTSATSTKESKNLTLNQIKYAIDHETGVLENHTQSSLELGNGVALQDVLIKFSGNNFGSSYKSKNGTEILRVDICRGGVFSIGHENIDKGVNIQVICKDLRSVQFELRRKGQHKVERNEQDKKTGNPVMRQYTAIARANGLSSEYITEVVGSLRALLRNREKGETAVAKEKNKERQEKTRGYQNERQAILQELRDEVRNLQKEYGVEEIKGTPKTNIESVQSFTKAGLRAVGSKTKTLNGLSKLLKSAKLFDTESAKAEYKSMVEAAKKGIEVTKAYSGKLKEKSANKSTGVKEKSSNNKGTDEKSQAIAGAKKVHSFFYKTVVPVIESANEYAQEEFWDCLNGNLDTEENFVSEKSSASVDKLFESSEARDVNKAIYSVTSEVAEGIFRAIKEYLDFYEQDMYSSNDSELTDNLTVARMSKTVGDRIKALKYLAGHLDKKVKG